MLITYGLTDLCQQHCKIGFNFPRLPDVNLSEVKHEKKNLKNMDPALDNQF